MFMTTISIPQDFHSMITSSFPKLRSININLRGFCANFPPLKLKISTQIRVKTAQAVELKENWLESLSCPFEQQDISLPASSRIVKERVSGEGSFGNWAIGIDPDVHGALALLRDNGEDCVSAQVFDTPQLRVMVGRRVRRRLDARSIVKLLHGFGAPVGTTAYIEQSNPCPQDGKLGWWSGGFTYGLWIGILVSSGFTVIPIPSRVWKDHFQLYRTSSSKDDSRKAALELFPSLSSSLKRKKDHGRAEALLIAAYGKGIVLQPKSIDTTNIDTTTTLLPLEDSSIVEHLMIN